MKAAQSSSDSANVGAERPCVPTTRIAVIIPYYQLEPGILTRALNSVFAQDLPAGVALRIYVIDDASPHPALSEMATRPAPSQMQVVLRRQQNGGPGSARNAALDLSEEAGDIDYIAFLDSDDVWHPRHLSEALTFLRRGFDFYCCDNARPGSFDRFSEDVPVLSEDGRALADRSTLLDSDGPVRGFARHMLDDEFVTGYLSHTSTVVLRAERVRRMRFDPDLRNASEDRMFWLTVALSGAAVAISWRCNVLCGKGVNLFFSAHDWNAPETIERVGCQLLFAEKLLKHPALTPKRRDFAKARAKGSRRAYGFLFLRALLRGRRPPTRAFRRLVKYDPWLPLRMPLSFFSVLADRRPEARQF